jgi:tetratricopeptide (TPR) repeat protein
VEIDDERLQELLTKASSLYNNGEYKDAIAAWQEALSVDPDSQKAREGVRMATLLLGDWEPPAAGAPAEDEPQPTADGAPATDDSLSAEETEARLDLGIARVKQLLAQRKFSEAIEGAKGLLPIDPESEEVRRLLDDAQQAFEAAPFIEEHLTLARELLDQERYPEAATQCQKVFVLDAGNPSAQELLARIKARQSSTLQRAASQIGGMTVKLSAAELKAAAPGAAKPGAPDAPASIPLAAPPEDPHEEGPDPDADHPEKHGEMAAQQEEVAARSRLEEAFDLEGIQEGDGEEPGSSAAQEPASVPSSPPAEEETIVEATTKVPPSVRLVPRTPAAKTAAAQPPASWARPDPPSRGPGASAPKAAAGGVTDAPPAKPKAASPSEPKKPGPDDAEAPPPGLEFTGIEEAAAWEAELAHLNMKAGRRDILKGTGVKGEAEAPAPDADPDADLMALLDGDLGGLPEMPGAAPADAPSIPVGNYSKATHETTSTAPPPAPAKARGERPAPEPAPIEADPDAAPQSMTQGTGRRRAPSIELPARRSAVPRYFALLGVLLLAGAAVGWWFFFQPRTAGGAGSPQQPGPPPPGAPQAASVAPHGPIPTPIGASSRPATQDGKGGGAPPATGAAALSAPAPTGGATGAAAQGTPAPAGGAPGGTLPIDQIKPKTPPALSPEEIHRRVATYTVEGKRLMEQNRWREARAKLAAALALDPVNFDIKGLLDEAATKVDEERKLQDEFDSSRRLFEDKDYQNALWKLYRLPRDKGLGDIDRYIRNAWFNWAVISMKGGDATDALQKLSEALAVDPDDAEALKLQEVGERYSSRAKDRIYYTFTDTLKLRAFDQK